jgi:hypothetical protein
LAQFKPQKALTFAVEARRIKNEGFWDQYRPFENWIYAWGRNAMSKSEPHFVLSALPVAAR